MTVWLRTLVRMKRHLEKEWLWVCYAIILKLLKKFNLGNHLIKSHATLIVAPASVLMQWDKEIKDRVDGRLRHIVCHGQNRERYADRYESFLEKN